MKKLMIATMLFAGALAGCDHEHTHDEPSDEGVIYEAGATDETWVSINDAAATEVPANQLSLTAPAAIDRSLTTPPAFTWGQATAHLLPRSTHGARIWHFDIASFWTSTARAHEPPVTGDIYQLVLDPNDGEDPIVVMTGATTYTPDTAVWTRLKGASQHVHVQITHAYFTNGEITEGPFASIAQELVLLTN